MMLDRANGGTVMQEEPNQLTILQRIFSAGPQGVMQAAGLFFTLAAAVGFVYGIAALIRYQAPPKPEGPFNFWQDVFTPQFGVIAIVTIGVVCALLALRLFSRAGSLSTYVIRPEDRDLLNPLI